MTQPSFDRPVLLFSALALLTSGCVTAAAGTSSLNCVLLFGASCVVFLWLATTPAPLAARLAMAAVLAIGPTGVAFLRASWWNLSFDNLLVALFGASGLLYGSPLLWAGFLGLIALRHERPEFARLALAAIVPGLLGLLLATDRSDIAMRAATWIPFLLPGIA